MPAIEALLQTSIEAHEAGDLRLAAEGFAAVLAVAPELPDAWYNAGLVAFQSGQNDQAIAALELRRSFAARTRVPDRSGGHLPNHRRRLPRRPTPVDRNCHRQ